MVLYTDASKVECTQSELPPKQPPEQEPLRSSAIRTVLGGDGSIYPDERNCTPHDGDVVASHGSRLAQLIWPF
jgi:hypothetical protein